MKPQIVRHGEVILKNIKSLPNGVDFLKSTKNEIIAHSETGHHHTLVATQEFKIYSFNGTKFIEIPSMAELRHEKTGKDVHKTHKIVPAIYEIVIKKEFDYFAGILRDVRD